MGVSGHHMEPRSQVGARPFPRVVLETHGLSPCPFCGARADASLAPADPAAERTGGVLAARPVLSMQSQKSVGAAPPRLLSQVLSPMNLTGRPETVCSAHALCSCSAAGARLGAGSPPTTVRRAG